MRNFLLALLLSVSLSALHAEPADVVERLLHSDLATVKSTVAGIDALSAPEKTKIVELLVSAMNSRNMFDSPRAAYALGQMGQNAAAALPLLESKLNDSEPGLRFQAGLAVMKLNPANPAGAAAVVNSLEYPGQARARLDALATLEYEGDNAQKFAAAVLARALVDRDVAVKKKAGEVFAIIAPGVKPDMNVIIAALKDKEPAFRLMAVHTLGALGPSAKKAKSDLRARLSDKDAYVKLGAAEAIYRIGAEDRKAIGILNDALRSEDFAYRHAAARAIRAIGPSAAATVPALSAALIKSRAQAAEAQAHETPAMVNDRGYRALLDLPYALTKALEAIGTSDAKAALITK